MRKFLNKMMKRGRLCVGKAKAGTELKFVVEEGDSVSGYAD